MDQVGAWPEIERVAYLEAVPLAEQRDQLALAEAQEDERLRSGRLANGHARGKPVAADLDMPGPHAVDHLLARRNLRAGGEWQHDPVDLDGQPVTADHRALQHVHRRRTDETGDEQVRRPV